MTIAAWFRLRLIDAAFIIAALVSVVGIMICLLNVEIVGALLATWFIILCIHGFGFVLDNWNERPWKREVKQ